MNRLRRSYEARVLLVPLGASADRLAAGFACSGLDGIQALTPAGPGTYRTGPLASHGWWHETGAVGSGQGVVAAADMVVLLASDLAEVSPAACAEISGTAQRHGVLTAALVVGSEHRDAPSGNAAMAALREAVDMLVSVRGPRMATPFLDVLRGGARHEVVDA